MVTKAREDDEFTAIRVATLRGDLPIPFDIYLSVAGKYILYCRRGDSFEGVRLQRLKAKKLKMMFIRQDDDVPYRQYLEQNIDQAYDAKTTKTLDLRAEVIQGFQQAVTEEFMENPLDEFAYQHARSSAQRFSEFLEQEPHGAPAILRIKNVEESFSQHGVNVATLSVAMTLANGMREGNPIHLMALGAFLHDTEHYFSLHNAARPLTELSVVELEEYRRHPLSGAHRFQGSQFLDQLVLNVISQHEEYVNGTGFPKGLTEKEMDPLVLVAATANAYERLISFSQLPPKEALRTLLIDKLGLYPLAHLQTLQDLLKSYKFI